jgi:hypothetical protein
MPVLARTSVDRANQRLSPDEEQRMMKSARRLLTTLAQEEPDPAAAEGPSCASPVEGILGCPAGGQGDQLVLQILSHKLACNGVVFDSLWGNARSLELLAAVEAQRPRAVCIAALPPRGAVAARYLCRRLRRQYPDLPIVVLAIASPDEPTPTAALQSAGANVVVDNVCAAREALCEIVAPATTVRQVAV